MDQIRVVLRIAILTVIVAQPPATASESAPKIGQGGKDVVWLPSPQALVHQMLELAKVSAADYLIDLGSGDGRVVIAAAERGARALGIEDDPGLVELSKNHAAVKRLADKAVFRQADLFDVDVSGATVITMFLRPEINLRLRPKILELRPGTRIVSNTFNMGEWEPDATTALPEGCTDWCKAFLWIVPAQVQGKWQLQEGELMLTENFQVLTGALGLRCPKSGDSTIDDRIAALIECGSHSVAITEGRVRGEQVMFKAGDIGYVGRVAGNSMTGSTTDGTAWSAVRSER